VQFAAAEAALKKVVPKLKAECDYLVLLSHASVEESTALARKFPEFHVVITAGGAEEPPAQPKQVGETLLIEPRMIVDLDKSIAFSEYLLRRFDHGRCYGAMSSAELSLIARGLRVVAAPLLPFVLLARWSRRFWARGRYRAKLIATLPLQLLMFGWWIAGETVGRVFGAGKSCSRLYY